MKALSCALALLAVAGFAIADEKSEIDAAKLFVSKPGTRWDYAAESKGKPGGKITMRISKIETIDDQKLIRLESSVGDKLLASEHISVDETGVYRHRMNGLEVTPPVLLIKFPVKDEETWEIDSKIGTEALTGKCEAGLEEVTVPAGKFQTVRVKMTVKAGEQEVQSTIWYAENRGLVQQTFTVGEVSYRLQLDKFEPAKE